MIKIVDKNNLELEEAVSQILTKILSSLRKSNKVISDALKFTTQRHFQTIYPNSNHYNPNKVTTKNQGSFSSTTPTGGININVPGITRAYRNLHITPKNSKYLTIPMTKESYGKRANSFSNLIFIKKKNGKAFLAQKKGSKLAFIYFLAKNVFQKRDTRLMPSDETYANNIFSRLKAYLKRTKI